MLRILLQVAPVLLLTGCATLIPSVRETVREVVRTVEVPALPPINPILTSTTDLRPGPYRMTDFEYKALWHLFGPPVARWAAAHTRIGTEADFLGFGDLEPAGFYSLQRDEIVLRAWYNTGDARRFANLVHEVAHHWEYHQYRHPQDVSVSKANAVEVYRIPAVWKGLNIEQEAEIVSLYAVLTFLLTRDDQRWWQYDQSYSRADLPRLEEYLRREMYF